MCSFIDHHRWSQEVNQLLKASPKSERGMVRALAWCYRWQWKFSRIWKCCAQQMQKRCLKTGLQGFSECYIPIPFEILFEDVFWSMCFPLPNFFMFTKHLSFWIITKASSSELSWSSRLPILSLSFQFSLFWFYISKGRWKWGLGSILLERIDS